MNVVSRFHCEGEENQGRESLSQSGKAIFDKIREKHALLNGGEVSKIIQNNLERKRLLGRLHRDGMARWVSDGSKAHFDKLILEALGRSLSTD